MPASKGKLKQELTHRWVRTGTEVTQMGKAKDGVEAIISNDRLVFCEQKSFIGVYTLSPHWRMDPGLEARPGRAS